MREIEFTNDMTGRDLMELLGNPEIGQYVGFMVGKRHWLAWRSAGRGKYHGQVFVHLKPLRDSWAFKNWLEDVGYVGPEDGQIYSSQDNDGYRTDYDGNWRPRRDMDEELEKYGVAHIAESIDGIAYRVLRRYEQG